MRAPDNKSRLDDIVREIVTELRTEPDDREQFGAWFSTEVDVRATIQLLRTLDQPRTHHGEPISFRGRRRDNAEEFTALRTQIEDLQKAFRKMSAPALVMMFSGEDVSASEVLATEVQQRVEHRMRGLFTTLAYMRARCDYLLEEQPGEHGSTDFRRRRVADEAWRLLKGNGKEPASGIPGSVYGDVATLLWEAMTGEPHKDLQRACKAALQRATEGSLRVGGPVIGRGRIPLS